MTRQFQQPAPGAHRYGSPMGRTSAPDLDTTRSTVRLFRVNIDAGGYDDGGHYWGIDTRDRALWCARDKDGDEQFTRASSREQAAFMLCLDARSLRIPLDRWSDYAFDLIDGRAPMPAGKYRGDVLNWMHESGAATGRARE